MIADIDDAIDQLENYAEVGSTPDGLLELYQAFDFMDLCVTRGSLADLDLTPEQSSAILKVDKKLKAAFSPAVLDLYEQYFPNLPVREWWG